MKNQPTIIIYTGHICPHCKTVKEFLREKGYEFEERDIREPANRKKVISMGFFSVPVTVIDGIAINGSNLEKINNTLEERKNI